MAKRDSKGVVRFDSGGSWRERGTNQPPAAPPPPPTYSDETKKLMDSIGAGSNTWASKGALTQDGKTFFDPTGGALSQILAGTAKTHTQTTGDRRDGFGKVTLAGGTLQDVGNGIKSVILPDTTHGGYITAYVQIDPTTGQAKMVGDPSKHITYTPGSSGGLAGNVGDALKQLAQNPLAGMAMGVMTGGMSLPAQMAANAGLQLAAGNNDIGSIVKGAAMQYAGSKIPGLVSGTGEALGATGDLAKGLDKIASGTVTDALRTGKIDPTAAIRRTATGAVTDYVGDTIKGMMPEGGIDIGGFKIDGLPDFDNLVPGVNGQQVLNVGKRLAATGVLGKDAKKIGAGVNAVQNIASGNANRVVSGVNALNNLTKSAPVRRTTTTRTAAAKPQIPPALLAAIQSKTPPKG